MHKCRHPCEHYRKSSNKTVTMTIYVYMYPFQTSILLLNIKWLRDCKNVITVLFVFCAADEQQTQEWYSIAQRHVAGHNSTLVILV